MYWKKRIKKRKFKQRIRSRELDEEKSRLKQERADKIYKYNPYVGSTQNTKTLRKRKRNHYFWIGKLCFSIIDIEY
jgi:hypothetical protein